jgi:hypothetical protein
MGRWRVLIIHLAAVAAVRICTASPAVPDSTLPPAETILESYVAATGGHDVRSRLETRVSIGTILVPATGAEGLITVWQAAPNLIRTLVQIPGPGVTERGCDGETVWEVADQIGPRVMEGRERDRGLREAAFDRDLRWRQEFSTLETVGVESVRERPAYKVMLRRADGDSELRYYDATTFLLVRSQAPAIPGSSDIALITTYDDYRDIDGVKVPFRITQREGSDETMITFRQVEHNVDIPSTRFEPPDEIHALLTGTTPEKATE